MSKKHFLAALILFWPVSAVWYAAGLPPWWAPIGDDDGRGVALLSLHICGVFAAYFLAAFWKEFWK